jgi:hypothetical protein
MKRRLLRNRSCVAALPILVALAAPLGCGVAKDCAEAAGHDSLLAGEVSIWNDGATPAAASVADPAAVELGVKFGADSDGEVTGVRFYKGPGNAGTHVGHLWTSTGTLLGSVTFSGETASGWQTARFAAPIPVRANTTCVASYYAPVGRYAANNDPVLNTPSVANGVSVTSSNSAVPIDAMLKRHAGATYLFSVAMRGASTTGTFTLRNLPASATAEVIGEGRSVSVANGVLRDDFAGYGVHLYRIAQ